MTPPPKILAPLARELAEVAATKVGACIRPLAVRRIDTQTGARTTIPIPCGATKASKCPPCADRARRLRMWQAHEGWHLDTDPEIVTAEPTAEQLAVIGYRADLEAARAAALAEDDTESVRDLERAIGDADDMLRAAGARGSSRPPGERKPRRVRSTRRRQDAPNLPRLPVADRTTGRTFDTPDGRTYRPSTFLTLTLPSYGRMYADGSPVDPAGYDYRRAARDAIHFGDLVDRFWQNLRRATGWNVQYFAAVEPQRRGAPHLHAAVRGTIPRKLLRQVAAATYHQVWWPAHDEPVYSPDPAPVWDETLDQPGYVDPDTGRPLLTWDQALDEIDADDHAEPVHVVRFGTQVDIQGVLGDTEQAGQCLRYLVKYLTKSLDECHEPDSSAAIAHVDRLADALRFEPCSPTLKNAPRTVRQFLDGWLESVRISVKPTTYSNYRSYVAYYVVPIIGDRKLQDIGPETITRLYGHLLANGRRRGNSNQLMYAHWRAAVDAGRRPKLAEMAAIGGVTYAGANRAAQRYRAGRVPGEYSAGLDARTVHSVHTMLNRAFRDAVTSRYITENPVTLATRVRQPRKAHDVWTADELRRFLAEAKAERLYAMWLMFATTGMRRSEAAGAQRVHSDTVGRTITLWDTRVIAGGQAMDSDGKSIRSRRQLALDRRTAAALADHLSMLDEERRLHGADYQDRGLLFCWLDGRAIYPETITDHFNRLVDRAGLPLITLHDVRHTYATMSLRAGVNPKIVSTRLGHATVAFTLDTYTQDVPELHHAAAETVSGLFLDDEAPDEPPIDLP